MILLLGRWLFLYYGFLNQHIQKDKDSYYIDSKGVKRRKTFLRDKDLQQMTIEQIDELEKTGIYLLPLDFEETLENYRYSKKTRRPQDFSLFKYNTKNLNESSTVNSIDIKEENLNPQKEP